MVMISRFHAASLVLTAIASVSTGAETAAPFGVFGVFGGDSAQVRLVSPAEGALMTGITTLRAQIEPASIASRVSFFVDSRQVCILDKPPFECEWDAGPEIAPHQVRLVVNLVSGGRIVQTARTAGVAYAETVDVDVVQVTVTVMDDHGRYVKGLPRSAFHVAEDDKPQAVSHFYSEDAPLELVAAVDISASMQPAMATMKKAVSGLLSAVPPHNRVTLLAFNDEVFRIGPKADLTERVKILDGLVAWGSTALYESIVRGVEILGSRPGRKALIIFTDGHDQGSHVTIDEVEQILQSNDLILYMIGQGNGVTHEPLKKLMDRLSRPTGGRAISTNNIDQLRQSFNELLEEMSNQYVLGYQPTNSTRDDAWREIKVKVDGYKRVRARQGYRAVATR